MRRTLLYFIIGSGIGFLLNHFLFGSYGWGADIFYGAAFGAAWATAYFLDDIRFTLKQKFLYSLTVMAVLLLAGTLLFNLELAVPALIKFSMVFVAYYLVASLRNSKSLRS